MTTADRRARPAKSGPSRSRPWRPPGGCCGRPASARWWHRTAAVIVLPGTRGNASEDVVWADRVTSALAYFPSGAPHVSSSGARSGSLKIARIIATSTRILVRHRRAGRAGGIRRRFATGCRLGSRSSSCGRGAASIWQLTAGCSRPHHPGHRRRCSSCWPSRRWRGWAQLGGGRTSQRAWTRRSFTGAAGSRRPVCSSKHWGSSSRSLARDEKPPCRAGRLDLLRLSWSHSPSPGASREVALGGGALAVRATRTALAGTPVCHRPSASAWRRCPGRLDAGAGAGATQSGSRGGRIRSRCAPRCPPGRSTYPSALCAVAASIWLAGERRRRERMACSSPTGKQMADKNPMANGAPASKAQRPDKQQIEVPRAANTEIFVQARPCAARASARSTMGCARSQR